MTDYYFDIETSDRDPWRDKVIAIAFQPLRLNRPDGELTILEAWKRGGEKGMLLDIQRRGLFDDEGSDAFDFIPVGTNLMFDLTFLIVRMREMGLHDWTADEVLHFFHGKPRKDIKTALVAMNDGKFEGSGLKTFSSKKRATGAAVPGREIPGGPAARRLSPGMEALDIDTPDATRFRSTMLPLATCARPRTVTRPAKNSPPRNTARA